MNATFSAAAADSLSDLKTLFPDERRSERRIHCHTVVTAIAPSEHGSTDAPRSIKAYSEDISLNGARVISSEPLPAGALFLKFLLPCFGERYVAVDVVNQSVRDRKSLSGPAQRQYVYGVRLTGIYSHREMLDQLTSSAQENARDSGAGQQRE